MRARKTSSKPAPATVSATAASTVVLCLYIVDQAPNSVLAVANLQAICQQYLKDDYQLEIINVIEFPQRALADGIVVTPSLSKLSPSPAARIVGNLSDTGSVLRALGISAPSGA